MVKEVIQMLLIPFSALLLSTSFAIWVNDGVSSILGLSKEGFLLAGILSFLSIFILGDS